MAEELIEFDAGIGTGGGQVLRTALSVSSILKKPIKLINIRANRPKKGLKPQHLTAVETLAKLTQAKMEGAELYSDSLVFHPGQISGGQFTVNIGTAGSISLLLQTIVLPCLFTKEKIALRIFGGTNVTWSPPVDFLREVFFPAVNSMGANFSAEISKYGFYPKGQGVVQFFSLPAKLPLKPIKMTKLGKLKKIKVFSHSASLPTEVSINQAKSAKQILVEELGGMDFQETIASAEQSNTIGSSITLIAVYDSGARLAGSALGERGKPAFEVGKEAAQNLLKEIKGGKACDSRLADQLIPFMALAKGESIIETARLSNHALTNIMVTEKLLGVKFKVEGEKDQPAKISVKGLGLK